jgi:hypothetical protein
MTATLLVAHRRVNTTQEVARAVIDAGIADVWAWVDGPRTSVEAEQTGAVVSLLESLDWPGEFHMLENRSNHGVAAAVPAALDWVFAHRDAVIVLEDDCVPTPEFFAFADLMLERYRDDPRVGLVTGTRIAPPLPTDSEVAYEFSMFPLIWGWATWRDRWSSYRHDIRGWRREFGLGQLVAQGGLLHAWDWYRLFNSVATEHPWSWDYQLTYMLWSQHKLAAIPPVDLVRNVGFGDLASHTATAPSYAPEPPSPAVRQKAIRGVVQSDVALPTVSDSTDRALRRLLFSPPLRQRLKRRLAGLRE